VLRLWSDQVRIALCPDRVITLHSKAGLRPRIVAKQIHKYSGSEAGWQATLPVLKTAVENLDTKNAEATLIISNHYTRFLLLPWNDVSLTEAEQFSLLQHRFDEVYGETSASWELRLHTGSFGSASLASGIEQDFLTQVKSVFGTSSLRLKSVQPYLMAAFNACRKQLGNEKTWLAVVEEGVFCVALIHGGQWQRIRSRQIESDWLEEVLVSIEREMMLDETGGESSKVLVYAPDSRLSKPIKRGTMVIHPLFPSPRAMLSPLDMHSYAMAAVEM
jgi:hypothetical protein